MSRNKPTILLLGRIKGEEWSEKIDHSKEHVTIDLAGVKMMNKGFFLGAFSKQIQETRDPEVFKTKYTFKLDPEGLLSEENIDEYILSGLLGLPTTWSNKDARI